MCGRFTLHSTLQDLQQILPALEATEAILPRYNVAPTQGVHAVANDAPRLLVKLRWGLIPRWAKDASIGSRLINARAESLGEKPAFRDAYKKRRCLVLADGFYEWKKLEGRTKKQPYLVSLADGGPFAFAGLWERWQSPEGDLRTCTIVTTEPNGDLAPLHDRMPVILEPSSFERWLSPDAAEPGELQDLLAPSRRRFRLTPVSTVVNSPAHDAPDCIEPVQESLF